MDAEGQGVDIEIFFKAPYDRFVNEQSRFWEASGIDLEMNAQAGRIDSQSLNSILAGGFAFETYGNDVYKAVPATADTRFHLHERKADAIAIADSKVIPMRLVFNETVRGLSIGAPVDFRGIEAGRVTAIGGFFDQRQGISDLADLYQPRRQPDRTHTAGAVYRPRPRYSGGSTIINQ